MTSFISCAYQNLLNSNLLREISVYRNTTKFMTLLEEHINRGVSLIYMEGPSVNIGCPSPKLLFCCIMFRHLLLTQADVPDFWTCWIVNGFGLGNPSPLFYGHPRVEVGRINAHPPMMNKTASKTSFPF